MANRFILHVVPAGEGWKVAAPGNSQPYSFHATKSEALAHAYILAREYPGAHVVIHARDGSVETEQVVGQRSRAS